jgi:hypothetical protein
MTDYREGPCRLISFLHLEQMETDPEIRAMHARHLNGADGVQMHGQALVADLVEALNRAYALSLDLALFHAGHHDTGSGDLVIEWKRLAIELERELAEHLPCQVQQSLEAQFDLPSAGESD